MSMNASLDKEQPLIDEASKLSFPASDPPPWPIKGEYNNRKFSDGKKISLSASFSSKIKQAFNINGKEYCYFSLLKAEELGLANIGRLPFSLKILLESALRASDTDVAKLNDVKSIAGWLEYATSDQEINFQPVRILMQDFTGVPAVVDLASMRDAISELGGNPELINPTCPIDLIIDHSVQVDEASTSEALAINTRLEMERNFERYAFLKWGQSTFKNFNVISPGSGICHQINLEFLAKTIWSQETDKGFFAFPDTLVGTDSHSTMVNGLGVLGWGVGGIEAEAVMLGQPISMVIPEVIGVNVIGKLAEGVTSTDLVLTVTKLLRAKGVVGKFVEFFGHGIKNLSVADRATISNMAPEYGATCGYFPIDEQTIDYLNLTNRDKDTIELVERYAKLQGLWHNPNQEPIFTDMMVLDLSLIKPCIAGPKRPQDQIELDHLPFSSYENLANEQAFEENLDSATLKNNDVVIAAITSCTNTSNPNLMIAAGLVAKKAIERGLLCKPWVKTSFAPGSQVVTVYLKSIGLQSYLDKLGFVTVGYGCTTCIGNSGPLLDWVEKEITENNIRVCSVLSGNRNFSGRIHPLVKFNYLVSPPLVVIFAIAGTTLIDLTKDKIALDRNGKPVYLSDLWPTNAEIFEEVKNISKQMYQTTYRNVLSGSKAWGNIKIINSQKYQWEQNSTYIQKAPFFEDIELVPSDISNIKKACILALFGDSITTDHISPAGFIKENSPAGKYLLEKGIKVKDFNSYGSRRGNYEVMVRGTFANVRIRNELVPELEGGFTKYIPSGKILPIYDAAMLYKENNTPLVIIAGKEYGTGSSRDWAAKGTKLLGVKAIIAESFERIHRSNLIGMGILPLQFTKGHTRKTLHISGLETLDINLTNDLKPRTIIKATINYPDNRHSEIELLVCIDTLNELNYYKHGGILRYVLRNTITRENNTK